MVVKFFNLLVTLTDQKAKKFEEEESLVTLY
jgi:hypothetical protein